MSDNKQHHVMIEIIQTKDNECTVMLSADTQSGRLIHGPFYTTPNDAWNTAKRVMASIEKTATYRGPGRKRHDHQQCRDVVFGVENAEKASQVQAPVKLVMPQSSTVH
jgi:hypothetical protein